MSVRVIVVNLPRHRRRRRYMEAQLRQAGLPYEFFDATDGALLDEEWLQKNLTESFYQLHKQKQSTVVPIGSVACADTYRRLYKYILSDPTGDFFLILQDDATLSRDFSKDLDSCVDVMRKSDYEMLLLFFLVKKGTVFRRSELIRMDENHEVYPFPSPPPAGALAVLLTRRAVASLYRPQADRINNKTDSWDLESSGLVGKVGVVHPTIVTTGEFYSTMRNAGRLEKMKRAIFFVLMRVPFVKETMKTWLESRGGHVFLD